MKKSQIAVLLTIFILGAGLSKNYLDKHLKARQATDIRYLPTPRVAGVLSFGFKSALADIYWIEALNYVGEQLGKKKKDYIYLRAYSDLILTLDPLFAVFYDWAGTMFIYNGNSITRDALVQSTNYINYGIRKFHEVYRYDRNTIVKGAFNYAIETDHQLPSIPYFELAARSFARDRDMLLVASSYAYNERDPVLASALKLEYLGQIAFEAQNKEELNYALQVLSSPRMNVAASDFVKALRIKMETEEDVRKLVENRLKNNTIGSPSQLSESPLPSDPRIENVLNIELSRTWMPADMLVLFSL